MRDIDFTASSTKGSSSSGTRTERNEAVGEPVRAGEPAPTEEGLEGGGAAGRDPAGDAGAPAGAAAAAAGGAAGSASKRGDALRQQRLALEEEHGVLLRVHAFLA